MADDRQKIEAEFEQIEQAIAKLPSESLSTLSELELSGVGGILQSIYNGVENILKQLFFAAGKQVPDDPQWHQEILRRAVRHGFISEQTLHRLVPYLTFRHLYRNTYVLDLRPDRMQVLLDDIDEMFNEFKQDIL
jgi:uncharacterized protein YutE (UPF0331/DUF86 family)